MASIIALLRLSFPPQTLTRKPNLPTALLQPHHPLRSSTVRIPSLSGSRAPRPLTLTTSASYNPTPVTDRLISAVAYFLPFFHGLHYGRFLFAQYPRTLGLALEPILPLLSLYRSVPFASFVAFFALYVGVVRNASLSRYVRFNAMQAVVLDVLLAVPVLLQRIFNPGRGIGFKLMVMGHNMIFVFLVVCFLYSLVYSILGRTPYLPLVADAAGRQL